MTEQPTLKTAPTLAQRRNILLNSIERLKAQLFAARGALSLVEELIAQEPTSEEGKPPDA